jgi:hypothetical protein
LASRNQTEGQHLPSDSKPIDRQFKLSQNRLALINHFAPYFSSVIDFGAGDCAAYYLIQKISLADTIHVVDPSETAQRLSAQYGICYSEDLGNAPAVDFIYSAHSIEHVHGLLAVMDGLVFRLNYDGCIFIETPA